MGHQVIITFDIDENKVQENAEKEAGRQIAREVIDEVFGISYNKEAKMRNYVYNAIRELLELHKEEIIAQAVKDTVENLHRTKAVKEKLQEALDGKEGT